VTGGEEEQAQATHNEFRLVQAGALRPVWGHHLSTYSSGVRGEMRVRVVTMTLVVWKSDLFALRSGGLFIVNRVGPWVSPRSPYRYEDPRFTLGYVEFLLSLVFLAPLVT
jgi:hypothetical protein